MSDNAQPLAEHSISRTWGEWLLLLLAALFPLLSVSVHSGGSTVYALLALSGVAVGWHAASRADPALRRWFLLLLLLLVLGALSVLYSADIKNGVERTERLLRLATLGLVFGTMMRFRVEAGRLFIAGLVAAAISMFVQALYQTLWLHHLAADGLYHKIIFGDMAMLIAVLLFAAAITLLRGWQLAVVIVAILLALYASTLSWTRGAWLMVPVTAMVLMWLYRKQLSRRAWLGLAVAVVAVLAAVAVLRPHQLIVPATYALHDLKLFIHDPSQATSLGARLNLWHNALQIWEAHPLLGTGIGDFNHDSRELVAQGRSWSADILEYTHAHSIYFDTLAVLGLTGLLVMIAGLFLLPGRYFYNAFRDAGSREVRFAALAGLLSLISFAVFGLSEGWLSRNPFVNPYVVYMALFAATVSQGRSATAAQA